MKGESMSINLVGGALAVLGIIAALAFAFVVGAVLGAYAINESIRRECGIILVDKKYVWVDSLRPVRKGETQ